MRWSPDDDAMLRQLFRLGLRDKEIAANFSATTGSTVTAESINSRRTKLGLSRGTFPSSPAARGWPIVPPPEEADAKLLRLISRDLRQRRLAA